MLDVIIEEPFILVFHVTRFSRDQHMVTYVAVWCFQRGGPERKPLS